MALASKFVYKPRTAEQVEKRLARSGGSFEGFIHDDYRLFKPAVGDNSIRFLPPTWDDAEHWGLEVYAHYNVGPKRASVLCPTKMFGKKCPICEAQATARKDGDEEAVKELAPRQQVVSYVVNMKDTSQGPLVWTMGFRMDSDFIKLTRDPEDGKLLQIDNHEEGYNVHFKRDGTTVQTTRYSGFMTSRKPSAIEDEWLEFVMAHPIPTILIHRSYDEIKLLFEGADDTKAAEEKPSDPPPAETKPKFVGRGSTPAAKQPEPEPETSADEQPETNEAEPEAVEEKPKPAAAAAASGMSKADELRAKLAARKKAA